MTNRHGEFKVNKLLLILLLGVIIVFANFQPQTVQQQKTVQQNAMLVAIDPVDGTLVRPNLAQRQALKNQQQTRVSDSEIFQYRNTWTVHPDGTKSGVVDPQFLHSIYATRNAAGDIVLHEGKEVAPQQPKLEVR
jgi:hypothetical protein